MLLRAGAQTERWRCPLTPGWLMLAGLLGALGGCLQAFLWIGEGSATGLALGQGATAAAGRSHATATDAL